MLVQEFTERTGYEPMSTQEWERINQVYTDSSLTKDQYCKIWASIHKEEIAIQKKAKRLHHIAYVLAHFATTSYCKDKAGIKAFVKELFSPNKLGLISKMCDSLSDEMKSGYFQIINGDIRIHSNYDVAAIYWYDNAQQSPIFKVEYISKNKFWFTLVRNIPMYDFTKVSPQFNQTHSY